MIDVNVDISGIVMCCDESILDLNIGHGYALSKKYLRDIPFKDKITDACGNLNIEYMGSCLTDEEGTFFICLNKHDKFQIEGISIEPNVLIPISGPMCSEQLKPYQEKEMSYLYMVFSLLHLFQQGNIGFCNVFFDYSYKTLGIMNNTVHNNSHSRSRNIVDQRKYTLTPNGIIACNQFLSDYSEDPFYLLKPSIDEFVWGIEQIDIPTGFEQYTTALEMTLLEKNTEGKKQKLANRVAVLLGTSPTDIAKIHGEMLKFYRFRSESLHEGDGTNISEAELHCLEEYARRVLEKCLIRCKAELVNDGGAVWSEIKESLVDDLKNKVIAAKGAGILPA